MEGTGVWVDLVFIHVCKVNADVLNSNKAEWWSSCVFQYKSGANIHVVFSTTSSPGLW